MMAIALQLANARRLATGCDLGRAALKPLVTCEQGIKSYIGIPLETSPGIRIEVLPTGQFATMFCAMIDFAMQKIEYASAGAPPQLYRASPLHPFEVISQSSLPLGIVPNAVYESKAIPFCAGGLLILYTDGLVETPEPPQSILTTNRLRELLEKAERNKSAHQLCQSVVGHLFSEPTTRASMISPLSSRNTRAP
jgi:Stage II sporulation protein E (SpoIIE)